MEKVEGPSGALDHNLSPLLINGEAEAWSACESSLKSWS